MPDVSSVASFAACLADIRKTRRRCTPIDNRSKSACKTVDPKPYTHAGGDAGWAAACGMANDALGAVCCGQTPSIQPQQSVACNYIYTVQTCTHTEQIEAAGLPS